MKNNQSSVSDADRDPIPRLVGRFRHYPFILSLGFLGLHRRQLIDSIYLHIPFGTLLTAHIQIFYVKATETQTYWIISVL